MEKDIFIRRYEPGLHRIWNQFNESAKNGLFLFDRDYMEYHADRFQDHSLLFYYGDRLVALLPANVADTTFYTHQGLTYGGFIAGDSMKQHIMDACFLELLSYLREHGFRYLFYKTVPHIFHRKPAEEDRYALFLNGAVIEKVEASTDIFLASESKMSKGRKAQISRARREGVVVSERTEEKAFRQFFALAEYVLKKYHDKLPVHTADEMLLLHERFPQNIHLYSAELDGRMLAGSIVYEYTDVVHTQYMVVNEAGRRNGALDLLVGSIIECYRERKKWIDFGISTENAGKVLNYGLISQKEGFGGRTVVYETYGVNINERH